MIPLHHFPACCGNAAMISHSGIHTSFRSKLPPIRATDLSDTARWISEKETQWNLFMPVTWPLCRVQHSRHLPAQKSIPIYSVLLYLFSSYLSFSLPPPPPTCESVKAYLSVSAFSVKKKCTGKNTAKVFFSNLPIKYFLKSYHNQNGYRWFIFFPVCTKCIAQVHFFFSVWLLSTLLQSFFLAL